MNIANLVDPEIYQAVSEAVSPEFAFSYLVKAKQHHKTIVPHTVVAWERLLDSTNAMQALTRLDVKLKKPERWHPNRDQPEHGAEARALMARQG